MRGMNSEKKDKRKWTTQRLKNHRDCFLRMLQRHENGVKIHPRIEFVKADIKEVDRILADRKSNISS